MAQRTRLTRPPAHDSRRQIIKGTGFAGAAAIIPGLLQPARGDTQASPLFTLGVASRDPTHDGVVIWTRLAPDPLNGGGVFNKLSPRCNFASACLVLYVAGTRYGYSLRHDPIGSPRQRRRNRRATHRRP